MLDVSLGILVLKNKTVHKTVRLMRPEQLLLELLLKNPNTVFSLSEISQRCCGEGSSNAAATSAVSRLRDKIHMTNPSVPRRGCIVSVRGQGYQLGIFRCRLL